MKILLASSSIYRRQQMDQLQIPYTHAAPQVDEALLKKNSSLPATDLPLFLAQKKAESLISQNPDGITIGSDQAAILDGHFLDKPGTKTNAIAQLLSMQGRTHSLHSALAVHYKNEWQLSTSICHLKMKSLSEEQIRRYVDLDNPIDCAGAYKIEKAGSLLFDTIQCEDPSAIMGLPLLALAKALTHFGYSLL